MGLADHHRSVLVIVCYDNFEIKDFNKNIYVSFACIFDSMKKYYLIEIDIKNTKI